MAHGPLRSMRSPLARVRGLGSAKEGVGHFWQQRVTAVALVPLTVWFVISMIVESGADYTHFRAWLGAPGTASLMLLTLFCAFHHAQLGVQVVIEDYVHGRAVKLSTLLAMKGLTWLFGIFAAAAVLKLVLA